MGARHVDLPDGRRICPRCHQTAVYDLPGAQDLFERVSHVVVEQLGLGLSVGAEFSLIDHHHLQRLAAEAGTSVEGDLEQVIGLFVRKGRKRVLYILTGLPRILFIQTVAHEWAHAWQGENCPLLRDPLVREGFAEWVAYRALQSLGAVKSAALMEQREGVYGEGLRAMARLERERGTAEVLAFCRRSE
jgi:hypothetical protein